MPRGPLLLEGANSASRPSIGIPWISSAEIYGWASLHVGRGDFRIRSHMSLMVGYVDFCIDTRDARVAYLNPRNLRRGCQLRIVERCVGSR
jgi:hypothetical protein